MRTFTIVALILAIAGALYFLTRPIDSPTTPLDALKGLLGFGTDAVKDITKTATAAVTSATSSVTKLVSNLPGPKVARGVIDNVGNAGSTAIGTIRSLF